MSLMYVFTPYNLIFSSANQPLSPSGDLILMANDTTGGVADDSRMTALCDWDILIDSNFGNSSSGASRSSIINMTASDPVLTIAGDYSNASSNKYNLKITAVDDRYEVAAVRAQSGLQLVLAAQSGAYRADSNQDANITIIAESTTARTGETYRNNLPSGNNLTALGFDVAGTLTLVSDLIGNITATAAATLQGIKVQGDSDYTATNTSVNQEADAIGIRAKNLVLNRNFNAVIDAAATATITGFSSLSVTGNTLAAKGLRALGDLSASDGGWSCSISGYKISESGELSSSSGEWNGAIIAAADGIKLGATREYVDKKVTTFNSAAVSSNDVSAYGIWADGAITIDHLKGKAGGAEITATASDNTVEVKASADSGATVTMSGNSFSAYGIKGKSATLKRVDGTFDIVAKTSGISVTGELTGSKTVLRLTDNKFYTAGIDVADTLTLGSFNGKVSASAENIDVSGVTGFALESSRLTDDTEYRVYGIKAGNIVAADNLGGVINVTAKNILGLVGSLPSTATLYVAGIYADSTLAVNGRINSTVSVKMTGCDNYSSHPYGYGIRASALVADAFSGSITVDAPLAIDNQVKSVGILTGAFTTGRVVTKLNGSNVYDAFDINGDIYGTLAGLATTSALNLRVSGNITTSGFDGYGFPYRYQDGLAITTDGKSATSLHNDQVELASTAVVVGDINLFGGENLFVINSGAKFTGKLLADGGLMDIRFDLDKTIKSDAIITVDCYEDREGIYEDPMTGASKYFIDSKDITLLSTSHITVNLNNAKSGTYTLIKYEKFQTIADNVWNSGDKGIAFSYQGQTATRNVTGGTAAVSFKDDGGNEISATLTYSGYTVTLTVENNCTLAAWAGGLTTGFDAETRTATLSWEEDPAFDEQYLYEVEYSIDNARTIAVKTYDTSVTINGFDTDSTVKWRVRHNATNGVYVSDWSEWAEDSLSGNTPVKPDMSKTNPSATNPDNAALDLMTASRALLHWDDSAVVRDCEIVGYEIRCITSKTELNESDCAGIYDDPSSVSGDPDKLYFTKWTTAPEILASQLPNQCFVYWQVRAKDANGLYSDWVDGNTFRVFLGDDNPPTWRNRNIITEVAYEVDADSNTASGSLTLRWMAANDIGAGVRRYVIEYKSAEAASWDDESVKFIYVDESSFTDPNDKQRIGTITGLEAGNYDFRITAEDYVGNKCVKPLTNADIASLKNGVPVEDITSPDWINQDTAVTMEYLDGETDPETGKLLTKTANATFSWGFGRDKRDEDTEKYGYLKNREGKYINLDDSPAAYDPDSGIDERVPLYKNTKASGVKEYTLGYGIGGTTQSVTVAHAGESAHTATLEDIRQSSSYAFSITALDYYGNQSGTMAYSGITLGDCTAPEWPDGTVVITVGYNDGEVDPETGRVLTKTASADFEWTHARDVDTSTSIYLTDAAGNYIDWAGNIVDEDHKIAITYVNPGSGVKEYRFFINSAEKAVYDEDGGTGYKYTIDDVPHESNTDYKLIAIDYFGNQGTLSAKAMLSDFTGPEWQDDTVTIGVGYDVSNADTPKTNATITWGYAEDADVSKYLMDKDGNYIDRDGNIIDEDHRIPIYINQGSGVREYVCSVWTAKDDLRSITIANTGESSYSWELSDIIPSQKYSYKIVAVDYYGNESVALSGENITLGDFTAPEWKNDSVSVAVGYDVSDADAPKTNATFSWGYAEDADTSTGDITNPGSGVKEYVITCAAGKNTTYTATVTNTGTTNYNYTFSDITPSQKYSYKIVAVDYYGNESVALSGENITLGDFTAPAAVRQAKVKESTNKSDLLNPKLNVDFSWNGTADTDTSKAAVTNAGSGVRQYELQYKQSSASSWKSCGIYPDKGASSAYSYSLKDIAYGLYDYRIIAEDYYGNLSFCSGTFGSDADITPPKGKFTNFSESVVGSWETVTSTSKGGASYIGEAEKTTTTTSYVLTDLAVTINWNDSFTDDNGVVYTVDISDNNKFSGSRTYSFQTTDKSLKFGTALGSNPVSIFGGMSKVYYRISVADNKGNVNPFPSAVQSFDMVDSVNGRSISFSGSAVKPVNLSAYSSKTAAGKSTLAFTWSDGDSSFGIASYSLNLTINGQTRTYSNITSRSYTLTNQADGTYSWTVTAHSGNGSTASASGKSFTVDTIGPTFKSGASSSAKASYGNLTVKWDAATDPSGIKNYVIRYGFGDYKASEWISTSVSSTSFSGTINRDGSYNYRIYAVDKNNNTSDKYLSGSFYISLKGPAAPALSVSTTKPTTKNVTVTAVFSSDSTKKQYSVDQKNWKTYSKALTVSSNGTYYFRGIDQAGNISKVASIRVSNIVDAVPAAPTVSVSTTKPTNQNVTVTAAPGSGTYKMQYSTNNKSWKTYKKAITVKSNATYYFRGVNASGVASEVTTITVGNIDKKKPDAPALSVSTTKPTNKNVTVTAAFSKDSAVRQYSTDKKTWKTYDKALSVSANGTYYFRGIDAAGNISKVKSIKIKNIDKIAPDAPKLKLSTTKITVKPVTIKATFGKGSTVKEYSVDGKKWLTLSKSLKVSANGTYYFRSADAAGNISKVSSIKVSNIASMNTANNNWANATKLADSVLAAVDTKSDKVDYYDVGDVAKLMLDMESGKAKVTFCGSNKKAVATKVKYANGSVATLSSLDLVSGNKLSDNITLADLGDAVKYLKLESATKGTGCYRLAKLA